MSPSAAPFVSRYTYQLHVRAAMLEGILYGVLITNDVVARKSLGATQWQIVLLTMIPNILQLLALLSAPYIQRVERRRLFIAGGVVGRLAFLGMLAVFHPWPFIGIVVIHGLVQSVLIPAQNVLYQVNYDPAIRGRLYGRAVTFGGLATVATAFGAGHLLDLDPEAYRWIYPLAGVAGFFSCWVFGSIRLRRSKAPPPEETPAPEPDAVRLASATELGNALGPTPLGVLRETLVRDAGFRRFETGIFAYGLGFMCMQPVFARLFVDELGMDYSEASMAKGVVFYFVYLLTLGAAGKLLDRIGLERMTSRSCLVLAAFAVLMTVVATPLQAVAGFALFGLGLGGISIAWTMGPVQFAPPGASARYMGVHVALVGVRALIGFVLGGAVAEYFGNSRPTFAVAAVFFTLAFLLLARAHRLKRGKHKDEPPTEQSASPGESPSTPQKT